MMQSLAPPLETHCRKERENGDQGCKLQIMNPKLKTQVVIALNRGENMYKYTWSHS